MLFDLCRATGGNGESGAEQSGGVHGPEGRVEGEACETLAEKSDLSGTDSESDGDGDGEEGVWGRSGVNAETYKRKMVTWKNEIMGKGQRFSSPDEFRYSVWKYAIAHRFDYKLERNCKQRIVVKCKARECQFFICVRGNRKAEGMVVKDFTAQHKHSVGDECQVGKWGRRRLRARLLARLIEGKIQLSMDYSPTEIMKDLELELGMKLSYMQSWRAREYVRLLVMGKLVDHYKLLPWMCAAIERANADSRAFVELDGCRFKRMFVALGASLHGFVMGCRKMLFVDGTHLSGSYEGTLLAVVALDADNHVFDVAYAVVGG